MTKKRPVEELTDPRDEFGLTARERSFCDHYCNLVQDGERNAKAMAAAQAGYSLDAAGPSASRLLKRPMVRSYIADQMSEPATALKVDRTFVLFEALLLMREANKLGDLRTQSRMLELIAKHVDFKALFSSDNGKQDSGHMPGLSLPFDLAKMSTDDKISLLGILTRAGVGGDEPARPDDVEG